MDSNFDIKSIEVKIANSKRLIIKDNIIYEKGTDVFQKRKDLKSDLIAEGISFGIVYFISKPLAMYMVVSGVVTKIVKFIV